MGVKMMGNENEQYVPVLQFVYNLSCPQAPCPRHSNFSFRLFDSAGKSLVTARNSARVLLLGPFSLPREQTPLTLLGALPSPVSRAVVC